MDRAGTVILRMRGPSGSLHYMQAYRDERVADVKSWLANVHGYPIEGMALRHGDTTVPDDTLASELPTTGLIAICLLPRPAPPRRMAAIQPKRRVRRQAAAPKGPRASC
jgi:hypothetical protein